MLEWNLILYLGIALVLGFLLGKATHWFKLTAIIGYIVAGIILGPVLNLVTEELLYLRCNLVDDLFIISVKLNKNNVCN